jgi:hypothetical protein
MRCKEFVHPSKVHASRWGGTAEGWRVATLRVAKILTKAKVQGDGERVGCGGLREKDEQRANNTKHGIRGPICLRDDPLRANDAVADHREEPTDKCNGGEQIERGDSEIVANPVPETSDRISPFDSIPISVMEKRDMQYKRKGQQTENRCDSLSRNIRELGASGRISKHAMEYTLCFWEVFGLAQAGPRKP